ncbi:hypothetical protein BB559_005438 [Furculomyces boomerangus]|uniref:Sister chromatid cohesion protein n=1 Tax=Furculomyces boomerangus TaxID=61424 RepID=A0A2T9Y8Q0_9FUNG|nr:hypothetical protein BB559_005438 [Furculomyces boomerangus]
MEQASTASTLSFTPKLFVGSNNKKLVPTQELFNELKKTSKELSLLDQEYVDARSLKDVAKQLVSNLIISHQSQAVQAYSACCLVDILRLFAPEAPYNDSELDKIFRLVIKQVRTIENQDNALYALGIYILDSLATVRSAAISAELEDSEEIMCLFFTTFFEIVRSDIPKRTQIQMTEILQQLIEENNKVPQEVLDVILLQFLKKRQKENPTAHQMSIDLCNNTATIMQKYVCQYFNDIIIASSKQLDSDSETLNNLKTAHYLILELNKTASSILQNVVPQLEEELRVDEISIRTMATQVLGEMFLEKGYTLARRYSSTWNTWLKRRSDKSNIVRIMWVEHAVLMLQKQPQLAKELEGPIIEKLEDIDEKVRKASCQAFTKLQITPVIQNSISDKMIIVLGERCKDRKQGPRIDATQALSHMYDQVYNDIANGNKVAIHKFGQIPSLILNLIYVGQNDIACNAEAALFGGILGSSTIKNDKARCLRLVTVLNYATNKAKIGFSALLKRQTNIISETELLFNYIKKTFITEGLSKDENSRKKLAEMIGRVAEHFPESEKFSGHLMELIKINDNIIFDGILKVMNPQSDFKTIRKDQRETMKRIRDTAPTLLEPMAMLLRSISLTTLNKSLVLPLLEIIKRSFVFDSNTEDAITINALSNNVLINSNELSSVAQDVLKIIVKVQPFVFSSHVESLFSTEDFDIELAKRNNTVHDMEKHLYTTAMFARLYPNQVPDGKELVESLNNLILYGSLTLAKNAATILSQPETFYENNLNLVKTLSEEVLLTNDEERACVMMVALSKFALLNNKLFENDKAEQLWFALQSYLNGETLLFSTISTPSNNVQNQKVKAENSVEKTRNSKDENAMDVDEELNNTENDASNIDSQEIKFLKRDQLRASSRCKIYALKFLINRAIGLKFNSAPGFDNEQSIIYLSVFKLIRSFIHDLGTDDISNQSGSLNSDIIQEKIHLKLTAGAGMLKLARQHRYDQLIIQRDIESLGQIIQDPFYEVRYEFVTKKLITPIAASRIHYRFLPLLFYVAFDPEVEIKHIVKRFVQNRLMFIYGSGGSRGKYILEESLVMLLYMLSRHPDIKESDPMMCCKLSSVYINYYIGLVATSENVSLIYSYVSQLKTVRDSNEEFFFPPVTSSTAGSAIIKTQNQTEMEKKAANNKLWILTDLCLYLIQQKSTLSNWSLSTSSIIAIPNVINSNDTLFTKLTTDQQYAVMSFSFLPNEFINSGSALTIAQTTEDDISMASVSNGNVSNPSKRKGVEEKVYDTGRSKNKYGGGNNQKDKEDSDSTSGGLGSKRKKKAKSKFIDLGTPSKGTRR